MADVLSLAELEQLRDQQQTRNILLFFPHNGTIRTEFALSAFNALIDPESPVASMREMHAGPVMGIARCVMVEDFLSQPYEWLLMIDADMQFTPGTIKLLAEAADPVERPIVGALCYTIGPGGKAPTLYMADKTEDGKFSFTSLADTDLPASELVKVDATGGAFLLIHRSVFKRMADADPDFDHLWFAEMPIAGELFGEDFSFCIRATAARIPIYVHTGARTGHVKAVILGEAGP